MQDIPSLTRLLLDEHPIRLKRFQKKLFLERAKQIFLELGYPAFISDDTYIARNHNLIAGSIAQASLVFSAHYDTPYRMLIGSNTIFPQNLLLTILVQLCIILPALALELITMIGMIYMDFPFLLTQLLGLLVLLFVMWLLLFCFANPHNANDNTSGVLAVLCIASMLPESLRGNVAFVLFDNEEKGMLGSLGFKKNYRQYMDAATLINFDCVGAGDDILLLLNNQADMDTKLKTALEQAKPESHKRLAARNIKGFLYPSDQMHFKKSIAAAAFCRNKIFGLYIHKLHSARDQTLDTENIILLSNWMINFMEVLHK